MSDSKYLSENHATAVVFVVFHSTWHFIHHPASSVVLCPVDQDCPDATNMALGVTHKLLDTATDSRFTQTQLT